MNAKNPFIKLSALTVAITETIRHAFASKEHWVVADITSHNFYAAKGHHYFDLVEKDENTHAVVAKLGAMAWTTGSERIQAFEKATGQPFKNDIHVLVKLVVEYHPVYGLRAKLMDIDPNFTIGLLEQQRQATLERLRVECSGYVQRVGDEWITANKQLALRTVIQQIAVVSAPGSAGLQDFVHTLNANAYGYRYKSDNYFTAVQGEANAEAFKDKLLEIFYTGIDYDLVVIIRGGGAQTDFLLFDQFTLAQVVAKFPIPIMTGIGHQKNETITDLMAHTSVKTPTKAAEFIIAHNRFFEETILSAQQSIVIDAQRLFAQANQSLSSLRTNLIHDAGNLLQEHRAGLQQYRQEIPLYAKHFLSRQQTSLEHHTSIATLLSPVNLLKKGFALLYNNGKMLTSAAQVAVSSDIQIRMADAELSATVNAKKPTDGTDPFNI